MYVIYTLYVYYTLYIYIYICIYITKLLETSLKVLYFEKYCPLNKEEPAEGLILGGFNETHSKPRRTLFLENQNLKSIIKI